MAEKDFLSKKLLSASGIAVLISVLSLGVAIKSCTISQKSFVDAHDQFRQERQLVLTAKFGDPEGFGCSGVQVSPIADGFRYQKGKVYLPSAIYPRTIDIANSGRLIMAGDPCKSISSFAAAKMRPKSRDFVAVGEGQIPLIIYSDYAVKGESYDDLSLYTVDTTISVTYDREVTVLFSGISFIRRLPLDEPPRLELLDELVLSQTGYHFRPKPIDKDQSSLGIKNNR